MFLISLHYLLIALAVWLISGTLLNFSKHPHWYIRGWDFPRVFTASLAATVGIVYAIFFHRGRWDLILQAGLIFVIARQLVLIFPYTRLAKRTVHDTQKPAGDDSIRLVISNLLQENQQHELWRDVVLKEDPDVIVVVELSTKWDRAIAPILAEKYPHHVRIPQDNYYGMAVYSRLAFVGEPERKHLVQEDIPSIHLTLKLRNGEKVRLHALHPRPPEPLRNQDSAARDAELVIVGREIGERERDVPSIVCGDLNDVAWSYTTQLFLRLSHLLDPRMGRGLYSSYNAMSRIFRFPLDHVFHSDEFKLINLRVLDYVGSDHYPMLIELSCQPETAPREQGGQPEAMPKKDDDEHAAEIIHEQHERESSSGDLGSAGKTE